MTFPMYGLKCRFPFSGYCFAWSSPSRGGYRVDVCPDCGRSIRMELPPTGEEHYLLEGGRRFPDFLYYAGGGFVFLVSERAATVFSSHGITGYDTAAEVPVYRKYRSTLLPQNVRYYSLRITGGIDLDLQASFLKRKRVCPSCGQFDWSRQRLLLVDTMLDAETWDGSDLCRLASFPGHIICTEKVKKLIEETGLTGAGFQAESNLFR